MVRIEKIEKHKRFRGRLKIQDNLEIEIEKYRGKYTVYHEGKQIAYIRGEPIEWCIVINDIKVCLDKNEIEGVLNECKD